MRPLAQGEAVDCHSIEARGLYVVADGTIDATVTGEHTQHTDEWQLGYGQYFGELGLMLPSAPLSVQYRAGAAEVTLLVLGATPFLGLFARDSSLLAELRMKVHQKNASLMTILEHRRARALFVEYLRKHGHGAEARLHFYEAVTQYMQLEPAGFTAAARTIAEGIVVEYIPDYAMSRVELPPQTRKEFLNALRDGQSDKYPELLERSREEVYAELEKTCLRPFTSSEPYTHMLQALSEGNDLSELQHELQEFAA